MKQYPDDPKAKWIPIEPAVLDAFTLARLTPNAVVFAGTNLAPHGLHKMEGLTSYLISGYALPVVFQNGMTAGAAFVVVRTDRETAKAYEYQVATSTDGRAYFNGPYKDFSDHHFASTSTIRPECLFGHIPRRGSGPS